MDGRKSSSGIYSVRGSVNEAFDMVLRHARNYTALMFHGQFRGLAAAAAAPVAELFADISLYILGSDGSVDDMVNSFFDALFPPAYRRLLSPGAGGGASEECLRAAGRGAGAFGPYPKLIMTRMSRSLLATRVFLQALNLGIEVINTTDHLKFGKDCARSLLRLWYCPHCQGLLGARPCQGYCLAVMQACLSHVAEVQPHWEEYIEGLGALAASMRGVHDMENVLLKLYALVRDAVLHSYRNRLHLAALVSNMCGHSSQRLTRSAPPPHRPSGDPRGLKTLTFDPEETLAGRRREFIASLRGFSSFYSNLPEALCSRESAVLNDSLCWNGKEIAERFPSAGAKRAQAHGTETKNKAPEPVISQIIDKLKHINQLLRLVSAPRRRFKTRSGGGGAEQEEEVLESGDCDDEDECSGSGLGLPPRHRRLRIFAELADDLAMDDLTLHQQLLTPWMATDGHGEGPASGAAAGDPGAAGAAAVAVSLALSFLGPH
nr:PREDICTED: glypican-3-like [Lepisosteus oculatus]